LHHGEDQVQDAGLGKEVRDCRVGVRRGRPSRKPRGLQEGEAMQPAAHEATAFLAVAILEPLQGCRAWQKGA
jgi:hypothetical protein